MMVNTPTSSYTTLDETLRHGIKSTGLLHQKADDIYAAFFAGKEDQLAVDYQLKLDETAKKFFDKGKSEIALSVRYLLERKDNTGKLENALLKVAKNVKAITPKVTTPTSMIMAIKRELAKIATDNKII